MSRPIAVLAALSTLACAPATFGDTGPYDEGSTVDRWDGPPPSCPIDPDCHIGGDCSLYECPDHWECRDVDATEVCVNPGPDHPDGGQWSCDERDDVVTCRRRGDYPDGGGGDGWSCETSGEFVECTSDHPTYPDDGGAGEWSCHFEGELRVCERRHPDDPGGECSGPGCTGYPDVPGEDCTDRDCTPPICRDDTRPSGRFVDDRDGDDDGQIYALADRRQRSCATVYVDVTGWYSVFDTDIAESCSDQLDEVGFLTVQNDCNPDGMPRERNVGDRFVVPDIDNGGSCASDSDCGAAEVCRAGNSHGRCCVPAAPIFMGTFLLKAGVANELCINHFCPEHLGGAGGDRFVTAGCRGSVNSIHFRLDTAAFLCASDYAVPAGCR